MIHSRFFRPVRPDQKGSWRRFGMFSGWFRDKSGCETHSDFWVCYDMICFKTIIRQLGSYHGLFGIQKHIGPLQKVKVKYHLRVKYHLCINLGRSLIQLINKRGPNKCDQGRTRFSHSINWAPLVSHATRTQTKFMNLCKISFFSITSDSRLSINSSNCINICDV